MPQSAPALSPEKLFDLALEVEGLLALALRREEMAPAEVFALLKEKAGQLAMGIEALQPEARPALDDCITAAPATQETDEERFLASLPALPGLDGPEESAAEESAATEEPVAEDNEPAPLSAPEEKDENCCLEATTEVAEEETAESTLFEEESDSSDAILEGDSPVQPFTGKASRGDLRKMFTLNDKFRFRRELFANSNTEFSDALNLVEAMGSYAEVEDYFLNDLGWNAEDSEVSDFLAIFAKYFA